MIIAVDPGKTTGLAIFAGSVPVLAKIEDPTIAQAAKILGWCQARGDLTLVLEDQFGKLHPKAGKQTINFASIKSLIRRAEVWAVMGAHLGISVVRVMPETWQGPMHRTTPAEIDGVKLSTKQRSQFVVRETWETVIRWDSIPAKDGHERVPSSKIPQDPCDAALLGRWYQLYGAKR
jgi:hypothetical protein